MVSSLASLVGAPEAGLRLILGQMAAYVIVGIHRARFKQSESWVQHAYFALTGLFMAWWAIGEDAVFHGSLTVLATYVALVALGNGSTTAILVFAFQLLYLFLGYVSMGYVGYDISWTMPQCVLCLRLIGVAIDVYDGGRPKDKLSKNEAAQALTEVPSLLEFFSHSFFVGGYFAGPQFCMKKYQDYIQANIDGKVKESGVPFGLRRLAIGWGYMLFHLVGSGIVPADWVSSDNFNEMGFLPRAVWFLLWYKIVLAKYIACWLFAEGACVISGLAYNGVDEATGRVKWNGCANVKLRRFETVARFNHMVESFNINTNAWVLHYVYKRLRFLNNKNASQVGTLAFLAVWHGYHSGYYVTFFNEFITIGFEKEMVSILERSPMMKPFWEHPAAPILSQVAGTAFTYFWLPHCLMPFVMLKFNVYFPVYVNTYFILYIFFLGWFLVKAPVKSFLLRGEVREEKKKE